jgi:hypothetical protein
MGLGSLALKTCSKVVNSNRVKDKTHLEISSINLSSSLETKAPKEEARDSKSSKRRVWTSR